MKFLLVSDILMRDHDGCNRTIFHLLDRADRSNIDIRVITGEVEGLPDHISMLKLPSLTLPINRDYKVAFPYGISQRINRFIDEFNPDVVHITTPSFLGNYILKICLSRGLKVTTIYHTNYISYLDYYIKGDNIVTDAIKKSLTSNYVKFYNQLDTIFYPTESMRTHLIDIGIDQSKLKIWSRGIDESVFNINNYIPDLSQQVFNNSWPILLFASRLVIEKNISTLIKLYNLIQDENFEANILIIGDGTARPMMELNMPKAKFLGTLSQNELALYYASSDVFVFPSVTETFGNVMVEAMACGLPIVAADAGANPDVVRNDVDGLLVPAMDERLYLEAIKHVLNDKSYYKSNTLNSPLIQSWDNLVASFFEQILPHGQHV